MLMNNLNYIHYAKTRRFGTDSAKRLIGTDC